MLSPLICWMPRGQTATTICFLIDIRFLGVIFLPVFVVMGQRTVGNLGQMNDSQIRVTGGIRTLRAETVSVPWPSPSTHMCSM